MTDTTNCKTLTADEYAQFFRTLKSHSDQDKVIINLIMQMLGEYCNKPIDIMSIGAGTGWLEDSIIKHSEMKVNNILAIEPNPVHVDKLREMGDKWNDTKFEIDSSFFDENYDTAKRFDVILMVHSIYGMKKPIESILKAKSLLKNGGKCLIFVQGEKGSFELFSKICGKVLMIPSDVSCNFLSGGYLSESLQKKNVEHEVTKPTVHYDVTDFVERNTSPTRDDIVSFFITTKYMDLNTEMQDEIYQTVKERIITDENGRHWFQDDTYMIVI